MDRIYLDHAANTPMVSAAIEAMTAELTRFGNASSLHGSGRAARRVVEESREAIASSVGARPSEVVFTSGGTEADNLAVKGAFWAARANGGGRNHLVSSTIEHHAVLDTLGWLAAAEGADVTLVGVDSAGRIAVEDLKAAVRPSTALVSVIWANNEVGTLQPLPQIAALATEVGARSHSDAVQAVGHVPVDFAASGLDTLSFTAHKLGGPYGVGALLAKREVRLTSLLHGGGQERDMRSGTLDVAAIAGFAAAVMEAVSQQAAEERRVRALRSRLVRGVHDLVPESVLNGTTEPSESLPGVVNLAFPGCEADSMLLLLDAAGIDCSTGSACAAGIAQPSHVLSAMGRSDADARSSLRFSLGHSSTIDDVDSLLAALSEAVTRARAAGALSRG
ncbi:MAG: cysteine desulfurase [Propionibacteriaceae bacterium]|nr:cysteine desulfurase [Propionibacteriaceae bacterium]